VAELRHAKDQRDARRLLFVGHRSRRRPARLFL